MFNPGETVAHTFVIPFSKTSLSQVVISYKQGDNVILERITSRRDFLDHITNGTVDPVKTDIRIELSQQESLLFKDLHSYTIQLNVYTEGGSRHASCEIKGKNGIQHHREVIGNE